MKIDGGGFAGGPFDWATPFGVMCGLGVIAGYALLGGTWLMLKTDGDMAERARHKAKVLLDRRHRVHGGGEHLHADDDSADRRALVHLANIVYLSPVPILTVLIAWPRWR